MMKRINHYQTDVLITLVLVMGRSTKAPLFHSRGALAMVLPGLFVEIKVLLRAMSDKSYYSTT